MGKSSEVVDNTDEHLQNMYEKVSTEEGLYALLKGEEFRGGGERYTRLSETGNSRYNY